MQNVHALLHPYWIATHAWKVRLPPCRERRWMHFELFGELDDRNTGPLDGSTSRGRASMLRVPKTTSTHGARSTTPSRSFSAWHPPTAILRPVRCFDRLQAAEVSVELVVGVLADRASVEDRHLGVLGSGDATVAGDFHQARPCARSRARSSGIRASRGRTSWPSREIDIRRRKHESASILLDTAFAQIADDLPLLLGHGLHG